MELKKILTTEWTLFLDRDGVINKRLMGDYVKRVEEFEFIPGVLESIPIFNTLFSRTVVVTNQQGIGKGLMTVEDLNEVHQHMLREIDNAGGRIDKVYFCPELAENNAACRKPNIGMAEEAKADYPEIDFARSIMVGDSVSDLEFGKKAGMQTVFISEEDHELADYFFTSLEEFGRAL